MNKNEMTAGGIGTNEPHGSLAEPASWRDYGFSVAAVGVCTAASFAAFPFFGLPNLVMIYLLGVLATAARGKRGPAAMASALSVLCFDFFFVPPRFNLSVSDAQYFLTFAVMFVVAMLISHLTIRLREEAEGARRGQRRTALIHSFTQQLAGTRGLENVLRVAAAHLADVFDGAVAVLLPEAGGRLAVKAAAGGSRDPEDKELGVAQWVYDRWQAAGLGTPSLPGEEALYVPLQGAEGTVGVLSVRPRNRGSLLAPEQRQLLDSFAHQIGLALEVSRLEESARRSEVEAEAERMRSSLLSSVSHDFRTPLAAVLGSAEALLGKKSVREDPSSHELLENIRSEAERLSRLVRNLLEATRLESGTVVLRKEPVLVEEIVGSALERVEKSLGSRRVDVSIPEDLPAVPADEALLEQVLVNLLENAARHTPPSASVEVSARVEGGSVQVTVADRGPGLKEEDLPRVFEKFHRDASSPGAGLGLAICRAVVKVHGGDIRAGNRPGGGAIFSFSLPLEGKDG